MNNSITNLPNVRTKLKGRKLNLLVKSRTSLLSLHSKSARKTEKSGLISCKSRLERTEVLRKRQLHEEFLQNQIRGILGKVKLRPNILPKDRYKRFPKSQKKTRYQLFRSSLTKTSVRASGFIVQGKTLTEEKKRDPTPINSSYTMHILANYLNNIRT